MADRNYTFLFNYLKKEKIFLDRQEFLFQLESHPDYPSLLAISDTLNFLNIQNAAIPLDASKIDLLPDRFIALLQDANSQFDSTSSLYYVEKSNIEFLIKHDKKIEKLSESSLADRWANVVLIAEENSNSVLPSIRKFSLVLPWLIIITLVALTLNFKASFTVKLFLILPFVGVLLSTAALKDLLGIESSFVNDFCKITVTSDCNAVLSSNKWSIFKFLNFSDLSVIFFSSQLVGFISYLTIGNISGFFLIYQFLLYLSIPIVLLSIYYQKFVAKIWCPICLSIISVTVLEVGYIKFLLNPQSEFLWQSLYLQLVIVIFIASIWLSIKPVLLELKNLKELQLKSNRFVRNYGLFRKNLLSGEKIEIPFNQIILGNVNSKTEITLITSPFCGYCKNAHFIFEELLQKFEGKFQLRIIIYPQLGVFTEKSAELYYNLTSIFYDNGENAFRKALTNWFENKDIDRWLTAFKSTQMDETKIKLTKEIQKKWLDTNGLNYTPTIFINGYKYPGLYERESLIYFFADVLDDEF